MFVYFYRKKVVFVAYFSLHNAYKYSIINLKLQPEMFDNSYYFEPTFIFDGIPSIDVDVKPPFVVEGRSIY